MLNVDQLLDHAADHARTVLVGKPKAELIPTWILQGKDEITFVGTPWGDDVEKELTVIAIRAMLEVRQAQSYSFMSEAWKAHESIDHPIGLMPRDRVDRIEVVIVNAFDRQGGKMRCYEIRRGPDGVVTELVLDPQGDMDRFEGRLYNLFQ